MNRAGIILAGTINSILLFQQMKGLLIGLFLICHTLYILINEIRGLINQNSLWVKVIEIVLNIELHESYYLVTIKNIISFNFRTVFYICVCMCVNLGINTALMTVCLTFQCCSYIVNVYFYKH